MTDNNSMDKILKEVLQHYEMWTQDNEKRMNRKGGWRDVTDAYYGKLPDNWPYISKTVDPRIRTSLVEKNARLMGGKLRGTFLPREGGDAVGAEINNAIINYQWDSANEQGTMVQKLAMGDMDTRLYQSKFFLVPWRVAKDSDGTLTFEGNELLPLDIRDCGLDPTSTSIKDAKWFQVRSWAHIEDLEQELDTEGKPLYKNLGTLKTHIAEKLGQKRSTSRSNEYTQRRKQLQGIEDRLGEDMAYPVVKVVTEYRTDKWITFAPDQALVLREIANPYKHRKIPVVQLRYYPVQDDPLGESEVEPVLPIWRAIQATLCGYMDEVILKMRPPLKVVENAARVETIVRGPDAQWLVDRQDAIEEMRSAGDSLQYFQTTYQALVAAFNTAMGDLSQGTTLDPFSEEAKTATEVRAATRQQNVRDQKNQNDLAEFIKDFVSMWCSNNKQFLFSDPKKKHHVLRIVGKDKYDAFIKAGLADKYVPKEMEDMLMDIIEQTPDMSPEEVQELYEQSAIPKHPIYLNPEEKDPTKLEVIPKANQADYGDVLDLSIIPDDIEGTYDYVPDVRSMSSSASQEALSARQQALTLFTSNPTVLQLLQQEGYTLEMKDIIQTTFEELGLRDASRFFKKIETYDQGQPQVAGANGQMAGPVGNPPVQGLPELPQANIGAGIPEQMARPATF